METTGPGAELNQRIAALRQEISIITPEKENIYCKPIVQITCSTMTDNFGQFIPPTTLDRIRGLEERVIVTNQAGLEKASLEFGATAESVAQSLGFNAHSGQAIVLKYPENNYWEEISEEDRKKALALWGSDKEEQITEFFSVMMMSYTTVHEALHSFSQAPSFFQEYAIRFYQKIVTDKIGLPDPQRPESNMEEAVMAGIYKMLIDIFGDDVHKIFFDSYEDVDPQKGGQILTGLRRTAEIDHPEFFTR